MEVTRENFDKYLLEILEGIKGADFIAIDTNAEATGFLHCDESLDLVQLKGPGEWYNALVEKQKLRSALDLGIAIFNEDKTSAAKRYDVKCFVIPILMAYVEEHDARQDARDARGVEERLQLDAVGKEFMEKIQFDFNKVLYMGTPFMNKETQLNAIKYMRKNPDFMVMDGKHVLNGNLDKHYFPKVIEKLEEADIQEIVARLRGVSKIFDATAESKVPVVGHNLLIKLIMLYKDFVEFLPKTYAEFLGKLEKVLPQFYDTKYIGDELRKAKGAQKAHSVFANTNLYPMFRNTDWIGKFSQKFILDEPSKTYEDDMEDLTSQILEENPESYCFESGFDALLTGILFTRLAIMATGSFKIDAFQEYAKKWKNKMFIQGELRKGLPSL